MMETCIHALDQNAAAKDQLSQSRWSNLPPNLSSMTKLIRYLQVLALIIRAGTLQALQCCSETLFANSQWSVKLPRHWPPGKMVWSPPNRFRSNSIIFPKNFLGQGFLGQKTEFPLPRA